MASGANPNDRDPAADARASHTGDVTDPGTSDHGGAPAPAERQKGLADFERLERAFIDRIFGGNRRAYETDYPLPE